MKRICKNLNEWEISVCNFHVIIENKIQNTKKKKKKKKAYTKPMRKKAQQEARLKSLYEGKPIRGKAQ